MSDASVRCPRCGGTLTGAPGDGCPACLLQAALAPGEAATMLTPVPDGTLGAVTSAGVVRLATPGLAEPTQIGPYRIVSTLGEGGMGVVYLAEQDEPIKRRVALKLIKLGMDTREVVARFDAERQALALMDHPHIAAVLDAGATIDGRPYFIMEYAPGVPITEYCDRHQLGTRARLDLFIAVCTAVQHAHQKGIIHRDLKPSNVLVVEQDGTPVPKVIDFGIAKATDQQLTEKTLFTQHGLLIGTPEYMSPEQAGLGGVDVDTRTDIYALGVILYELLVGAVPFSTGQLREAGYGELLRVIREDEPRRPSTQLGRAGDTAAATATARRTTHAGLTREVRGDLDWITLKALEKDRARRYQTASELAADLTRHLGNEPVVARPPSVTYRAQKFVRRNRLAVTAAGLLLVTVLTGLIISLTMYVTAERRRREADVQRLRAEHETCSASLLAANLSLSSDHTSEALRRLDGCSPYLRDWEWHHLDGAIDSSAMAIDTGASVSSLAFGAGDAAVRALVFRTRPTESMQAITASIAGEGGSFEAAGTGSEIALSGDGRFAAVSLRTSHVIRVGKDGAGRAQLLSAPAKAPRDALRLRDLASGQEVTLPVDNVGEWTSKGPEQRVFTAGIWSSLGPSVSYPAALIQSTGVPLWRVGVPMPYLVSAVFSRDGSRLAAWSWANEIRIWDTSTRQLIARLKGHHDGITSAAFSPDNTRLFSGSFDRTVIAWDVRSQKPTAAAGEIGESVLALAASADGRYLGVASDDGSVQVYDAVTLRRLWAQNDRRRVRALAFTPDGRFLASGGDDGQIRIRDSADGFSEAVLRGHTSGISALAISGDGRRVASGSDDRTVRVWNLVDAALRVAGRGDEWSSAVIAFTSDRLRIFSGSDDQTVRVWDSSEQRTIHTLTGHVRRTSFTAFSLPPVIAVSRDERIIATGGEDETVRLWHARSGAALRVLDKHGETVTALTLTDAGDTVFSGADDGIIRAWSSADGRALSTLRGHRGRIRFLALTRDGRRLISSAQDKTVRVWDAATRQLLRVLRQDDHVTCVALSPDGSAIASGSSGDALRLWHIETGELIRHVTQAPCSTLVFTPDGRRIATASLGQVRLLNARTLEIMLTLDDDRIVGTRDRGARVNNITALAFGPDGESLASTWTDGAVRVWNARPRTTLQRARSLVDLLFTEVRFNDEAIQRIRSDVFPSELRESALRLAQAREDDPSKLNEVSWDVVATGDADRQSYEQALRRAEVASRLKPTDDNILNTLALAQYRVGLLQDASKTLDRISKRWASEPGNVVLRVLIQLASGEIEPARATLTNLLLLEGPDADVKGLIAEAKVMLDREQAKPARKK